MLEAFNTCLVNALDYVFGWMLLLPRDLSLFSVAILTSASLSLIRCVVLEMISRMRHKRCA